MNRRDLKKVAALRAKIGEHYEALRELAEEARANWDDRSERWQESDDGVTAEERISVVEQACDDMENALGDLDNILEDV